MVHILVIWSLLLLFNRATHMHPIQKVIIPDFIILSEFRLSGSLIFDFNDYLKSIGKQNSYSFKLLPKANPLHAYIELRTGGRLMLTNSVDHEFICIEKKLCKCGNCVFALELTARSHDYHYFILAKVKIEDKNDNFPVFSTNSYTLNIQEDISVNKTINLPKAIDRDSNSPEIQYKLTMNDSPFMLGKQKGNQPFLFLTKPLDRELQGYYNLILEACDVDINRCSYLNISITVSDVNDEYPLISNCPATIVNFTINAKINTIIFELIAYDPDLNDSLTYGLEGESADLFTIDQNGRIKINQLLSKFRKINDHLKLTVVVKDRNKHISKCSMLIKVNRYDDYSAIKLKFPDYMVLYENFTHYVVDIMQLQKNDLHCVVDYFETLTLTVVKEHPFVSWTFAPIDNETYSLIARPTGLIKKSLPQGFNVELNFTTSALIFIVHIVFTKTNMHSPFFKFNVNEAYMIDANAYQVDIELIDADVDDNVTVSIPELNLTKMSTLKRKNGIERSVSFTFLSWPNKTTTSLIAFDNGWPRKNSSQQLAIIQFPGKLYCKFSQAKYYFKVKEDENQFGPIRLFTMSNYIDFQIYPADMPFLTNQSITGQYIFFRVKSGLDREKIDFYRFTLHAVVKFDDSVNTMSLSDHISKGQWIVCAHTEVIVTVEDVNDNAPVILFPLLNETVQVRLTKGCIHKCALLTVEAFDPDSNTDMFYSLIHDGDDVPFSINTDGTLIYTGQNLSTQVFTVSVLVSDMGQPISLNSSVSFYLELLSAFTDEIDQTKGILLDTPQMTYTIILAIGVLSIISIVFTCIMFAKYRGSEFHLSNKFNDQLSSDTSRTTQEYQFENDSISAIKALVDQIGEHQASTTASNETSATKTCSNRSTSMLLAQKQRENLFLYCRNKELSVRNDSLNSNLSKEYHSLYLIPKWIRQCNELKTTLI